MKMKAGSKEECLRIARLCWMQCEKGKSKEEVLAFRAAEYQKLEKRGAKPASDTAQADKDQAKVTSAMELTPNKREKRAASTHDEGFAKNKKKSSENCIKQ